MSPRESGYVALIAVLITAAAATASALAILDVSSYRSKAQVVEQRSVQARALASACADEALILINGTTSFTGTGTYTLAGNSCTYTVTSTGSTTRTVLANAAVLNTTKKIQASVTIGSTTMSVTSWTEVP